MMSRTQITLDTEIQRRARQRAADLGISLAEYVRRLVARDIGTVQNNTNVTVVFDLGGSGSADIARHKSDMIAEVFAAAPKPRKLRRA